LHEYCRKNIDLCPAWSIQTMQAILLTEMFTRFRGRKAVVRCSRHFEELYGRLLSNSGHLYKASLTYTSIPLGAPNAVGDHPTVTAQSLEYSDLQGEWTRWIDAETRRRLIGACFKFDVQQAMYHEKSRLKGHFDGRSPLLCLPCPENLWLASSPPEWQTHLAGYAVQPLQLFQTEPLRAPLSLVPFSKSLLICSFIVQLPVREIGFSNDYQADKLHSVSKISQLFPDDLLGRTCLSLYYTPLFDLLAIAGDTWVFAQKITPPSDFHAARSRLKAWSSSFAAAAATQHACHILQSLLSSPYKPTSTDPENTVRGVCVSEYWPLYIAALICWAFGHRYQNSSSASGQISRAALSSAVAMDVDAERLQPHQEARISALTYATSMLELGVEDLLTNKASMRGDTSAVVDAVKARLELDSVGSQCMMLDDAVGVLRRIKESGVGKGKWF